MKHLKLSNEQQKKLLEMCYALLKDKAEHSGLELGDEENYTPDGITLEKIPNTDDYMVCFYHDDGTDRIHWFELCMHDLAIAVAEPNYHKNGETDLMNLEITRGIIGSVPNPIDYLYFKFKQLK